MGIKVNVGVCKKVGLDNYGSAGGHCNVEIELDSSTLERPEEFQKRVQHAYRLCRESVENELANHRANGTTNNDTRPTTPPKTEYRNSPTPTAERTENGYPATEKQQQLIGWLTKSIKGLSPQRLDEYCQTTFGTVCNQLSAKNASKLIDDLKAAKGGGKEIA